MVDDIARLGLAIDTTGAEKAKASLNGIPSVAARAEKSFDNLSSGARNALRSLEGSLSGGSTKAASALDRMSASVARSENAVARMNARTGLARHEMLNLSRQVQDVGVQLAGGQGLFTILAQQGPQIADVFAASDGSVRGFASQIAAAITPARALGVTLAAVGAATVAAGLSWKNYALRLDDASRASGVAFDSLSKLQAAASFKGIANEDFSTGITKFSRAVYDARNNIGELAQVFRVNGVQVRDTNDALNRAADLIKNARDDQQRLILLQQMGLPATMQWVRLLQGGAEGLTKAKLEAIGFGSEAEKSLIEKARRFDEGWNQTWTNFGRGARGAFVDVIDMFDRLDKTSAGWLAKVLPGGAAAIGTQQLKFGKGTYPLMSDNADINNLYGAFGKSFRATAPTAGNTTVDVEALRRRLELEQPAIGLLGTPRPAAQKPKEEKEDKDDRDIRRLAA